MKPQTLGLILFMIGLIACITGHSAGQYLSPAYFKLGLAGNFVQILGVGFVAMQIIINKKNRKGVL